MGILSPSALPGGLQRPRGCRGAPQWPSARRGVGLLPVQVVRRVLHAGSSSEFLVEALLVEIAGLRGVFRSRLGVGVRAEAGLALGGDDVDVAGLRGVLL